MVDDTLRVGALFQFQLNAMIVTSSDRYGVNGEWQVVRSSPVAFNPQPGLPFQQISAPTADEWTVLTQFPNFNPAQWSSSTLTLADNSLVVRDAEAVGPSRQTPVNAFNNPGVGQSLFLSYQRSGWDPDEDTVHWLQFVTTNTAPFARGGAAGTPGVDSGGVTPFYDEQSPADGTGLADLPSRRTQAATISWSADLFLVQARQNAAGGVSLVIWQGVRWGWYTVPLPRVAAVNANAGPAGGGYTVTISGDGFSDASAVAFGGVTASSFVVNSDNSITATVPPGAIGTVDVTVTTPAGPSDISSDDAFTYFGDTTTLSASSNPGTVGSTETLSATVMPGQPWSGPNPTGSVSFYSDGTLLGSAAVNGVGQASLAVTSFTAGQHSITGIYAGDSLYPSNSASISLSVNQGTPVMSVFGGGNVNAGEAFTVSVAVGSANNGPPAATGQVTFTLVDSQGNHISLGTLSLDGSGDASLTTGIGTPGTYQLLIDFQGDADYQGSSWSLPLNVING